MVMVDKEQNTAVRIVFAIPGQEDQEKKECKKIPGYQGLKEQLESMWKVKSKVVLVVIVL